MEQDPKMIRKTERVLEVTREKYGFIPVVNQVLSERPDMFLPMAEVSRVLLEGDGAIARKDRFLCAVAAASALGGEHCLRVQSRHAVEAGATRDELLEAMTIGSYMAMTRSQSYAYRAFAKIFDVDLDTF